MASVPFTPDCKDLRRHVWALKEEFDKAEKKHHNYHISGDSLEHAHSARGTLKSAYNEDELVKVRLMNLETKLDRTIADLEEVKKKLEVVVQEEKKIIENERGLVGKLSNMVHGAIDSFQHHEEVASQPLPGNPVDEAAPQEVWEKRQERTQEPEPEKKETEEAQGDAQDAAASSVPLNYVEGLPAGRLSRTGDSIVANAAEVPVQQDIGTPTSKQDVSLSELAFLLERASGKLENAKQADSPTVHSDPVNTIAQKELAAAEGQHTQQMHIAETRQLQDSAGPAVSDGVELVYPGGQRTPRGAMPKRGWPEQSDKVWKLTV